MALFFCVLSLDLVKGGFLHTVNQNLDISWYISLSCTVNYVNFIISIQPID